MVQVLVEEDALGLGLGLVLGTQLADLVVVDGTGGLGGRVHRHQVHDGGDDHEEGQDGADDDGGEVELGGASGVLPGNHQNKDDEDSDEGDGRDGDDEAFSSSGIHLSSSVVAASACASSVRAAVAAARIRASVGASVGTSVGASVPGEQAAPSPQPHEAHVVVPGQRGGHTGKHSHTHDDDDDAQYLHHAGRGSPAVEVKHLVPRVVGEGWVGHQLAVPVSAAVTETRTSTLARFHLDAEASGAAAADLLFTAI